MKHNIALVGFGTVGQGLCEILVHKRSFLKKNYNYDFNVVAISDIKYGTVYRRDGLNLEAVLGEVQKKSRFAAPIDWDAETMIRQVNADVICELSFTNLTDGEPAVTYCRAAFETGKHVVTSNKGPAALAYRDMMATAAANKVKFLIEGTVMSGTPVLNLARGPLAGCSISAVRGIVNGTTNYILTEMEGGASYGEALARAQELGYAEADPAGDVEGYDARAKVTIITNVIMGQNFSLHDVACTGITHISPEDIRNAKAQGARWKLIGSAQIKDDKVVASVRPEMVPLSHPLAGIMGATNALTFATDLLGEVTIVGPGAGRKETGFSILTDLLSLHLMEEKS